jgi:hypothetical protein
MEKPPDISHDLKLEVESRIRSQSPNLAPLTALGPPLQQTSPPKQSGCLRTRRTGLSTVMEVAKPCDSSGRDSLHPPSDRFSPVRRLAEVTAPYNNNRNNSISSGDASPSSTDVKMLQEPIRRSFVSAEKFTDNFFALEFWTTFRPKTADKYVSDDFGLIVLIYATKRPLKEIIIRVSLSIFSFVRKFRPKPFHKIGPRRRS